jgi:hypothetical protein
LLTGRSAKRPVKKGGNKMGLRQPDLDRFSRPLYGELKAVKDYEPVEDIDEVIDDIKYEIKLCKGRLEHFTEKAGREKDTFMRGMYRGMMEGDKAAYESLKYVLESAEQNKKHAG